jgi:DNA helicase-2/ATP-dependent DNA helicase PcrA
MPFTLCEKRQSVLDATGHCLVMGGPGSGKTTLALMKAMSRVRDGLAESQTVLFLSFSRAAVARIMDAASGHIPPKQKPDLSIQTFHSFFWQILRGYGYLLGAPRRLSIVLAHDEKAMRDGIERESPSWKEWEAKREELFHQEGRVCFDLFAPLTATLLRKAITIRNRVARRYPLILVDEAQDTGNEQWECVKLLSERSQVICLADPNQMIYDFLPGVGPKRIGHIRQALNPHEIDLGTENQRSPGTEIATFARDILTNSLRRSGYKGVSRLQFRSSAAERNNSIRSSIGVIIKRIKEETGSKPTSLALITSYSSGVAIVSSALQQEPLIRHQVLFDEAFALLASRTAAFLLEPKNASDHVNDVATLLELTADAFRAKATKTAREQRRKCGLYAASCRQGKVPSYKVASSASALITSAQNRKLSGDPRRDWLTVKQDLRQLGEELFKEIASQLDYLVAFARGKRIAESLSELWLQHAAYPGAREALDTALTQDQLLSGGEELRGIHVMNMHKCKGKQFDGVILYRQQHHSPFVWRDEAAPYQASRRLLHMAITRARLHVLILDEVYSTCPIIDQYTL